MSRADSRAARLARRRAYAARACSLDDRLRGGVGEQVGQGVLEDPAGPAGAVATQHAYPLHGVRGPADDREPEVGPVRLGVGAHEHRPLGQLRPEAAQGRGGQVADPVVLDDEGGRGREQPGQFGGAGLGHGMAAR